MYNTKNYTEQGGEKTVIGGELEIKEGATFTIAGVPYAPAEKGEQGIQGETGEQGLQGIQGENGVITPATYQADSVVDELADVVADLNALIAKFIVAGLMEGSGT